VRETAATEMHAGDTMNVITLRDAFISAEFAFPVPNEEEKAGRRAEQRDDQSIERAEAPVKAR